MTKVYSSDLILNTSFVSTGEVKEVVEGVLGCYRSYFLKGNGDQEMYLDQQRWKDFLLFLNKTKLVQQQENIDTTDIWKLTQNALEQDLSSHSSSFKVQDFIPLYHLVINFDKDANTQQLKTICDAIFKKHI